MKFFYKPFKGTFAYEWQIGPVVLVLMYPQVFHLRPVRSGYQFRVFIDYFWTKRFRLHIKTKMKPLILVYRHVIRSRDYRLTHIIDIIVWAFFQKE